MKILSNIEKLKVLTDSLIDRDSLRVKVLNLFDRFCNDFPIPMNAWIVDKNLKVLSKKGSLIKDSVEETSLDNIFSGENREENIRMHKRALSGEIVTYTLNLGEKVLLTRLIPSSEKGDLVFGISMDVTSFYNMSKALDAHCDTEKESACEILNKVKNDPLYEILKLSKGD